MNCEFTHQPPEWALLALECARADCVKLRQILLGLKRGSCWCEAGIGNPIATKHSAACVSAMAFFADRRIDGLNTDEA